MDEILKFLKSKPPYNPKQSREDFIKNKIIVPGELPISSRWTSYKHRLPKFEIPTTIDENALEQLRLYPEQYRNFFSDLLYAEEYMLKEELKMYDRQGTTMNKVEGRLILKVPGLAEKRPSVLEGDHILVVKCGDCKKGDKEKAYQGFVHKAYKKTVDLKFGNSFLQNVYSPRAKFNVRFTLNRISMRRMHQALNNPKININRLFPQNHENIEGQNIEFEFDTYTPQNLYQKRAVAIIKSGIHHPWPFIVFGPPGTGKSSTIVEAMWQLLDDNGTTRILACAASNAAADWLLKKLSKRLLPEDMVRVNAISQDPEKLDSELRCYCVIDGNGKYQLPGLTYIETRKVVVTTCITAGAVYALGRTKSYTHIFVDEAGQALEPEIVTALQNASKGTKIILAGDPKQLGPFVRSPIANRVGLGKSLIERLEKSEFYDFCDNCRYGVKLLMNYRSHPEILSFPNDKFYKNELKSSANEDITHNLINFSFLPKKGYPLMFWPCEEGKEKREGQSPSWFNAHEASYVLVVVKQLLKEGVRPEEIGVITPYVQQVKKINKLLKKKKILGVETGTVEKFQGQERRVIIISTVRSESPGFIEEERRFCVTVTRAQALLVVIGNPNMLSLSELWGEWLEKVRSEGGIYSTERVERLVRKHLNEPL